MYLDQVFTNEEIEKLKKILHRSDAELFKCEDCKHFLQHYVKGASGFIRTNAGHCVEPRMKAKKPNDRICCYFSFGERNG